MWGLLQNNHIASVSMNLFPLDNISTKITASFWASIPAGIAFASCLKESQHKKAFDVNSANYLVWNVAVLVVSGWFQKTAIHGWEKKISETTSIQT